MRPSTQHIGPVLSAREARARRACERWIEAGNDARGCPVDELARVVAQRAAQIGRDLDPRELHETCVAASRAHEHEREQRAAEEARKSAAEVERDAYLRRQAERLRLARDDEPEPPRRR